MNYTAHPERDALAHDDAQEAAQEATEHELTRLSDEFVSAAAWGASEPLDGATVADALYEVGCSQPELIDAFFYKAAADTKDPAWRAMVREIADAWASIRTGK